MGNIRCCMESSPLGSTHGQTTLSVACHHCLKEAQMGKQRQAWHDITAFGQHTRLNNVTRGIPSSPIGSKHGRQRRAWHDITPLGQHTRSAMSGVACITALGQHTRSDDVKRGIISPLLDSTQGRTMLGVARHHRLWTAHTIGRRRA